MKFTAVIVAAALIGGTAFAQTQGNSSSQRSATHPSSATTHTEATHEGIGVKTKRAFKRMGDKMRTTGNKLARATHTDRDTRTEARDESRYDTRTDTRTMGASGSDTGGDGNRRARMDSAYDNWKSRQR